MSVNIGDNRRRIRYEYCQDTLSDTFLRSHLAIGNVKGSEIPIYSENPPPLVVVAASFRSSVCDMVKYLYATMGLIKTILDSTIARISFNKIIN